MHLSSLWELSYGVDCAVLYVALCYHGPHPRGQGVVIQEGLDIPSVDCLKIWKVLLETELF